ncbi:Uncharacterised protein [Vibrio cholerae]|nr:Uncharacterised protein [Vibrio cholerae]
MIDTLAAVVDKQGLVGCIHPLSERATGYRSPYAKPVAPLHSAEQEVDQVDLQKTKQYRLLVPAQHS